MTARAICTRGHGHERGRACADCAALERERAAKAVPLQDTLERLECADTLVDVAALDWPFHGWMPVQT
jgi:hypothetical protein